MERRGSGLKKILSETAKLPGYSEQLKPEFHSTPTDFRVVLKNVNFHLDGAAIQDKRQDELVAFCTEARTREEMQSFIGIANRSHFRKTYLNPLLESGKLKMTIPNKPSSKYQKYIKA